MAAPLAPTARKKTSRGKVDDVGIAAELAELLPDLDEVPESLIDDAILESFLGWTLSLIHI